MVIILLSDLDWMIRYWNEWLIWECVGTERISDHAFGMKFVPFGVGYFDWFLYFRETEHIELFFIE
jgi:hypothetical protein